MKCITHDQIKVQEINLVQKAQINSKVMIKNHNNTYSPPQKKLPDTPQKSHT